ncbi:ABC transporter substrate-binding protein [Streptomyces paradoxus]|uniref:ABC transporter substrate-binding protein n=1 Tax=Streptomyces paradoxus TaxID=66375 RepID=UPI003701FC23
MQVRDQSVKARLRLLAALVLAPCPAGCFVSPGGQSSSQGGPSGARLRVALAFPPAENFSPYGVDATLLSRLGVTEGLTALDANGAATPALARPDGTSITLPTYDNRPELPEVAQVVQQQLQKAGFTVKLEVREYSRLESDALAGKYDAFIGARNSLLDTGDPVGVLGSDYTCDGGYNLARLCDERPDRAVAEAVGTDGTGERQDAAMAAEAVILGTDAVVPLAHQRIIVGVSTGVRGVLLDPYERTLVGTGTRR